MRIRHTITFSSARGVPEGSEDGPYGGYATRTVNAPRARFRVASAAQAEVSPPTVTRFVRTSSMPQPLPQTSEDAIEAVDQPPTVPAAEDVVDGVAKVVAKDGWKPAMVAFMGFLVVAPGSSVLVRLVAAGFGANALWGEGGLLKKA